MDNIDDVKFEDTEGSKGLEEPLRKQFDIFKWISTVIQFAYVPFSFPKKSLVSPTYWIILHVCVNSATKSSSVSLHHIVLLLRLVRLTYGIIAIYRTYLC